MGRTKPIRVRKQLRAAIAAGGLAQASYQRLETQQVGVSVKARHSSEACGRDEGLASELLPGVGIGKVNFHSGEPAAFDGVKEGVGRMGQRTRVDYDTVEALVGCCVHPIDQQALMVALPAHHFDLQSPRGLSQPRMDLFEGRRAVDLRLTLTQAVEIRAAEHQDTEQRGGPAPPGRR